MSRLKKDFKYHEVYDNKYSEQTYLTYLCRGKKKYVIRSGDYVPRFIIETIDFIIRCNNAIARRGSEQKAIETIKNMYSKFSSHYYASNRSFSLKSRFESIEIEKYDNEMIIYIYHKLEKLIDWENKFETNFDEFKDYIFDEIKEIDDEHYCWVLGENIIYDRSIVDNQKKKTYCVLNNEKLDKRFKERYFKEIYIESKDKKKLYKQISYLLIILSDVNNLLLTKDLKKLIPLLEDYFDNNENIESCKDIYYLKIYYDLHHVYELISQGKNHVAYDIIKGIIEKENEKYKDLFTIFESIAIDLNDSEYSKVIEL